MTDDEAVLAFIHFQERHAGELPVISELNEPSAHEMRAAGRIGERHDLLLRHGRFLPDRDTPRVGNGALEFDDSQLFPLAPRQAQDAGARSAWSRSPVSLPELHIRHIPPIRVELSEPA
ncbi:hypothetical protein [Bradyrhizobium sp. LB11.1]|uniref:hypothetical protein n=1 Tax=Bradyrhizobium sp. LB11.1 TaxID=3156326 RepID=UPI003390960B